MKRIATLSALTFLFLIALVCAPVVYAQSASKVLMIVREGYSSDPDLAIKMEVGVMDTALKNAGYGGGCEYIGSANLGTYPAD